MSGYEILFLSVSAFCTSALTAVVGAGGGTALIALMLQVLTPAVAIPVHGAVQLASNTTRVWLFWRYLSRPIILRFIALMPLGVWLGLILFQYLSKAVIEMLIGVFVLLSIAIRWVKPRLEREFPLWAFIPIGFATGALNMVVGVIAPLLGVFLIRIELKKENIVGTLGFFGFIGNLLKIAGFSLIGFSFIEYGLLIACMVPSAIAGTYLGRSFLSGMDENLFIKVFHIMLILLALKLIFQTVL